MTERTPVAEQPLTDGAKTTRWAEARQRLENPERGRTYRLATVHPDGRPHVMPLLGLWLNGAFSFVSGESTRKGKNLAGDARCVITTSSTALPALDIIIEGDARKVTDDGLRSSRHHWHGAGSRERRRIQPDPLAILDISPQ